MKSVLISVVRNEEDIIESFVRHHAKIFDHIFITSHQSKDYTNEILNCLQKEGLNLTVSYASEYYHNQGELITDKIREVRKKHKPQVFMMLDADEFVVGNLKNAAHEIKNRHSSLSVAWRNYTVTENDDENETCPIKRLTHRSNLVNVHHHKQLVPGCLFDMSDITMREGCHHVFAGEDKIVPFTPSKELKLAHFPVRSPTQFMKKSLVGWLSKLANPNNKGNKPDWSHWKIFYDRAKKGNMPSLKELQCLALGYTLGHQIQNDSFVYDPLKADDIDIKYQVGDSYGCLEALADAAELFALELGK